MTWAACSRVMAVISISMPKVWFFMGTPLRFARLPATAGRRVSARSRPGLVGRVSGGLGEAGVLCPENRFGAARSAFRGCGLGELRRFEGLPLGVGQLPAGGVPKFVVGLECAGSGAPGGVGGSPSGSGVPGPGVVPGCGGEGGWRRWLRPSRWRWRFGGWSRWLPPPARAFSRPRPAGCAGATIHHSAGPGTQDKKRRTCWSLGYVGRRRGSAYAH